MIFLTLLAIPLLIGILTFIFGRHRVTLQEFAIQVGVQVLITGMSVGIIYYKNTSDVEIYNGRVTAKQSQRVSCSHSYSCHCRTVTTGTGKNRRTTTRCKTCYYHPFDMSWVYNTSDNGSASVSRVDSQGLKEPPRWTAIQVGEPSSSMHGYENYIKASPDSLFRKQGLMERYANQLPNYPKVYDYYRIDRVLTVDVAVPNLKEWNQKLSEINAKLNPHKQVNATLVLVKGKDHEYFDALEQRYLGGKKNDVILVVSIDRYNNIMWADVMSWTDNKALHVSLRDAVLDMKVLDLTQPDVLLSAVHTKISEHYAKKSMEDFKYLQSSITPSLTEWIVSMLLGIFAAIGMSFYFYTNDIHENKQRSF
jgi:hypothetical protein